MRLYVAGPMTGLPEWNRPAFAEAAARLEAAGFEVVNPASLPEPCEDPEWLDWMRACIPQLLTCDGVAMLPGWVGSRGAVIETLLADDLGLPVMNVDQWVLRGGASWVS